jgi:hypothetical protein
LFIFHLPFFVKGPGIAALLGLSGWSAAGAEPADWHHLHLGATDTAEAAGYARHMHGQAVNSASADVAVFGETRVVLMQGGGPQEGSSSRSFDHFGRRFDNLGDGPAHLASYDIEPRREPMQPGTLRGTFVDGAGSIRIEAPEHVSPSDDDGLANETFGKAIPLRLRRLWT